MATSKNDLGKAAYFLGEAARRLNIAYGCAAAQSHSQSQKWEEEAIQNLEDACAYLRIKLSDNQP